MTAPITYGSLFTGVGGADLGFDRAGMRCLWQCEIDKNCRRLLAKRWPEAKLYHDITTIDRRTLPVADIVVGGSPCQDLSVAGKRAGLAGERSGLFRTMVGICKSQRKRGGARVVVWENVDGAFSSNDGRDFAAVLRAFTGVEVVVPDEGWGRAGFAKTPFPAWRWNVAWRVLDAQWFGVAQRRRRVFLVASAGDGSCAEILFEPESLRGDNPPSREAREGVAGTLTRGSIGGGSPGGGDGREQFLVPETAGTLVTGGKGHSAGGVTLQDVLSDLVIPDVAACVNPGDGQRNNPTHETLIPTLAHTLRGEGHDATEDGTGRGTPLIPIAFTSKDHGADAETDLSPTLRAGTHDRSHANGGVPPAVAFCADVSPTLGKEASGPTKSPSGQMVDFCIVAPQTSPALNTEGGGNRAPDTKAYVVTAFNLRGREGGAMPEETDVASVRAAASGSTNSYVAFAQNQREEVREMPVAGALQTIRRGDGKNETLLGITPQIADPISAHEATTYSHAGNNAGRVHNIVAGVRRLTPRECERLMAFPDDWTKYFHLAGQAIISAACPTFADLKDAVGQSLIVNAESVSCTIRGSDEMELMISRLDQTRAATSAKCVTGWLERAEQEDSAPDTISRGNDMVILFDQKRIWSPNNQKPSDVPTNTSQSWRLLLAESYSAERLSTISTWISAMIALRTSTFALAGQSTGKFTILWSAPPPNYSIDKGALSLKVGGIGQFADSTRYKMNGNAIVSTVTGWIGKRIVRFFRPLNHTNP